MSMLVEVGRLIDVSLAGGRGLRIGDLHFRHDDAARLTVIALIAVSLVMVVLRSTIVRRAPRHRVGLPALLSAGRSFSLRMIAR